MKYFSKQKILLPVIEKNNLMKFYPWKKNDDVLTVNEFGMLEPIKAKAKIPDVIISALASF